MKHECEGINGGYNEIMKDVDGGWYISLAHNCCGMEIKYCPCCGEELDHWEWKMKRNES